VRTAPTATDIPFPSPTAGVLLPFATATSIPFRVAGITPGTAIAASGARLTIRGMGFDALATVTIGAIDITDAQIAGPGSLSFVLPAAAAPGIYTVIVTEPDGRRGTLPHALTIQARLVLRAGLLHPVVSRGATAVVLAQTLPAAQLSAGVTGPDGHSLTGISLTLQRGPRGEWRLLLAIGPRVPLGQARVIVVARWRGQQLRVLLALRVVGGS
jgi:hypothetical protein